jgi:hypothetical protein
MSIERFVYEDECNNIILSGKKDVIYIDEYKIVESKGKLFVLLIKKAFDELSKVGYKKHQQYVSNEDWNSFLCNKEEWKVLEKDNLSVLIECNIEYAAKLIIESFLNI